MSELQHYGVLGMKWGVRKDRKPQGYGNPNYKGPRKPKLPKKQTVKKVAVYGGLGLLAVGALIAASRGVKVSSYTPPPEVKKAASSAMNKAAKTSIDDLNKQTMEMARKLNTSGGLPKSDLSALRDIDDLTSKFLDPDYKWRL